MSRVSGIGWVPGTSSTVRRVRGIIPAGNVIIPFEDDVALLVAITEGRVGLTMVEAGGSSQELAIRTLLRIRQSFPSHPIMAWCDLRSMSSPELLDVARISPDALVRHGEDDNRPVFSNLLADALRKAAGREIYQLLGETIPRPLKAIFERMVERARDHTDLAMFAATFGISRRTLHNRLVERGLPPTRRLLTWCRLMVAAALLDQPGHSLDTVAIQLGFNDGHALGVLLKRYAGEGINQMREGSVLQAVVSAFCARVDVNIARLQSADHTLASLPAPSTAD